MTMWHTTCLIDDDEAEAGSGRALPVVECDGAAREVARDEGERGAQRGGHLVDVVVRVHRLHRAAEACHWVHSWSED